MGDDRDSFLRDCVVCVASDDYESFEIIFRQTSLLAHARGITVDQNEVRNAIERPISEGLLEAFVLSQCEPHSVKSEYSPTELYNLWYYVTSRGKSMAKSVSELGGEDF